MYEINLKFSQIKLKEVLIVFDKCETDNKLGMLLGSVSRKINQVLICVCS